MLPLMDVVPHCTALLSYVSSFVLAHGSGRIVQLAGYLESLRLKNR